MSMLRRLSVPDYQSCELEVATKYYALATVSALLKYIEFVQNIVWAPKTIKFRFQGPEQTTMIGFTLSCNAAQATPQGK